MNSAITPDTMGTLPSWATVLAVVAHPDDESFGLGAVLDGFVRAGATVSVLCLTQGEASRLGAPGPDLSHMRAMELQHAAHQLGVASAVLRTFPDGALAQVDPTALALELHRELDVRPAEGIVIFDPTGVSGHPDHTAASEVALAVAAQRDLDVLGWTLPASAAEQLNDEFGTAFVGHGDDDIDLVVRVDRERQRMASLAHASQAAPTSVLWRRLDLLGDHEYLRWLRRATSLEASGARRA
ncbi:PIG-L deacetylase family protein [Nocardioides sp.]|uniref:PIG-L deacetylase family protein n=1 Tax=Nocardioides sp. TaxID=35761 RepID=UPI003D13547B